LSKNNLLDNQVVRKKFENNSKKVKPFYGYIVDHYVKRLKLKTMKRPEQPSLEVMNGNSYEDLMKRNEYIIQWMEYVGLTNKNNATDTQSVSKISKNNS